MILSLQAISTDATLNNFFELGSIKFIPGQALTLNLRLMQTERPLRFIPADTALVELTLLKSDGTSLTVPLNFLDDDDRSLLTADINAVDMEGVISQNLIVTITDGTDTHTSTLQNGLQSAKINGC